MKVINCLFLGTVLFLFGVLTGLALSHAELISMENMSSFPSAVSLLFVAVGLVGAYFIYIKTSNNNK